MSNKFNSAALLLLLCGLPFASVAQTAPAQPRLTITTESLPEAILQQPYHVRMAASGGVSPLHWIARFGELPPGLELNDDGTISGVPTKTGRFRFSAQVTDSDQPYHRASTPFTITVVAPLLLEWRPAPRVQDNRITGGVKLTNGTKDDFDLTLIIVAVNETGKAFALQYQHLDLKAGTADFEARFDSLLPQGAYIVHADAVAEVASRNSIFRRRLQTPAPLQITAGP